MRPLLGVLIAFGLSHVLRQDAVADERAVKVTLRVSSVPDAETAATIRAALSKVEGTKVSVDDLQPFSGSGDQFKNQLSSPFVTELTDRSKADLGHLAKAVAEAKVKRSDRGPWLNLILYDPNFSVDEEDVVAFRQAMSTVAGLDATGSGGVGGDIQEDSVRVRIDGSGVARLEDILTALKKAEIYYKIQKP